MALMATAAMGATKLENCERGPGHEDGGGMAPTPNEAAKAKAKVNRIIKYAKGKLIR